MREMTRRRAPVMARADRSRLAFLTSTHVVDDLYQGAVPALLPFLAIERHYSYAGLTGITLAATFLASVVQPGFGALTDRHRNLGWLVAAGLLVAGLGIGLSGLGDSYLITWCAVAASGVGVAAYHPEATRTARGMAGDSTQAMSWFSVGGNIGIALGPVIVTGTLNVAAAIIAESTISFLGLGFPPDTPTWGRLLFDAKDRLDSAPHWALAPGAAICITVLAINFIGDGLRDVLDPRKVM